MQHMWFRYSKQPTCFTIRNRSHMSMQHVHQKYIQTHLYTLGASQIHSKTHTHTPTAAGSIIMANLCIWLEYYIYYSCYGGKQTAYKVVVVRQIWKYYSCDPHETTKTRPHLCLHALSLVFLLLQCLPHAAKSVFFVWQNLADCLRFQSVLNFRNRTRTASTEWFHTSGRHQVSVWVFDVILCRFLIVLVRVLTFCYEFCQFQQLSCIII